MKLTYTPKRIGYKNDAYITRSQLAFLDYKRHLNRPQLKRKDKTPVFVTRFGKRSAQWFIAPVPEPKKYIYIPSNKFINMVKIIIQKRINKKSSIFISCNGE